MPAPIYITEEVKNRLKTYLCDQYKIEVKDAFDCINLRDKIKEQKDINLSLSTIRRFYDLIKYSGSHSRFTLNQIVKAVGFSDYDTFQNHVSSYDINIINQNLQLYQYNPKVYGQLLANTIQSIHLHNWNSAYQIQNIISVAIIKKDTSLLQLIIDFKFISDVSNIYEYLSIAFQDFYFESLNGNKFIIDFVKKNIAHSYNLQRYLMQSYADETRLNDFIGEWFDAANTYLVPDFKLFKNLMLTQRYFQEGNQENANQIFKLALSMYAKAKYEIHPILKARISAWSIILNNDYSYLNKHLLTLSIFSELADFSVFTSRLLWIYSPQKKSLSFLNQINFDNTTTVKTYAEKGRFNILQLSIAINFYLDNNYTEAYRLFKSIDRNTFGYDIVNMNFYVQWMDRLANLSAIEYN